MFNCSNKSTLVTWGLGLASVLSLMACQPASNKQASNDWFSDWKKPSTEPLASSATTDSDQASDQAARKAQEQADRLAQALRQPPAQEPAPAAPDLPNVRWLTPPGITPGPGNTPRTPGTPGSIASSSVSPGSSVQSLTPPAGQSLATSIQQLRKSIQASPDLASSPAVTALALSLLSKEGKLVESDVAALDAKTRSLVLQYHQAMQMLLKPLNEGRPLPVSTQALGQFLDRGGDAIEPARASDPNTKESAQPLQIRSLQLCKRVRGFGVYEPIESLTLLSGRSHRMIVYTEVDHFTVRKSTNPIGTDSYQVKLHQEVSLFNEADGLEVWRQPKVEIVDDSRNHRRDFFLVQMIDLPARLGVGKYRLNVRVIDALGQSRDEKIMSLQVVADPALVNSASSTRAND